MENVGVTFYNVSIFKTRWKSTKMPNPTPSPLKNYNLQIEFYSFTSEYFRTIWALQLDLRINFR